MTAPARILVLIDTLLAGGAERLAVELACALDRTRFEPHVVVTRFTGPLEQLLIDGDVPYTMLERSRRIEPRAWYRAHRLARSSDLIHAHKYGSNVWGAMLARSARRPLVAHEHNFSADASSRLRGVLERRWIAPVARCIICVSESVAQIERNTGIPERLLTVVPNGVRLEAAWPRAAARDELGLDPDDFVIGIVGRLRTEKAHDVLLDALAQLRRAGRRDLRLCVVGDGPCADALRAQARDLDLADQVVWAGERPDAARLAAAFDASVICSHWEGLPLAALEAMAAGVPLVASAVGGLPELLADGAGKLVAPGDPSALAGALAALADDPVDARSIAVAGQRRVRSQYAFRRMVQHIETIYDEVLSDGRGTRRTASSTAPNDTTRREAAA